MKLSVIIPVYNTEKYIERCINSVISQYEKDLEIILVDDGSTDSSAALCDDYSKQYNYIRTIHISNSGPATAKNEGFDLAKGEYISFIDSDDEIEPEMYNKMLECADSNNADITCCSYIQIDENGTYSHKDFSGNVYILNKEEGIRHLLNKDKIYSQCWTKIYRKELLDIYKIRFIDGLSTEEDFIYNMQCFAKSTTIAIIDVPLYIYTHRESSLSRNYYKSHLVNFLRNMTYRLKMTREILEMPTLKHDCVTHCLKYYNLMIGRASLFNYDDCIPYYRDAILYMKHNKYTLVKNHSICGLSIIGAMLIILLSDKQYFNYRKRKIK